MDVKKIIFSLLFFYSSAFAQVPTPIVQGRNMEIALVNVPCSGAPYNFSPTDIGQGGSNAIYITTGTITAISAEIDGNPDGGASHWISLSSPATATAAGAVTANIWLPFLRLRISSCTGSGTISAWYGSQAISGNPAGIFNSSGGATNPVSPLLAPDGSPTFWCNQSAPITISGSGALKIISGIAAKEVRVCSLVIALSGASNLTIQSGTGTNCGSSTAGLTGAFTNVLTFAPPWGNYAPLRVSAGLDVCINLGSNVTGGGVVMFAQDF